MTHYTYPIANPPSPGTAIEVAAGIKWLRMPMPLALDHINLYLLTDHDGWFIVDTGLGGEVTERYWEEIFSNSLEGKPVKGVIVTHMHADHVGKAGWLVDRWRVPLWMTEVEYLNARVLADDVARSSAWQLQEFYQRAGLGAATIEVIQSQYVYFRQFVEPVPVAYQRLRDGQKLQIGGREWRIIVGRGHSPEHACLYCDHLGILISGDQVLPRISSIVSVRAMEPEADPLALWLESLQRLQTLPANTLVLPAHNTPFYGLPKRLQSLAHHHEDRLRELEKACLEPRQAVELLPILFGRQIKSREMILAVGECIAHLHCLRGRQLIERTLDKQGVYRYHRVAIAPSSEDEFDEILDRVGH